jgi:hypothetical protein
VGMITACHHLVSVEKDMKADWTKFWQEAQYIFREVRDSKFKKSKEKS